MTVVPILVVCGVFSAVLLSLEIGHHIGVYRRLRNAQHTPKVNSAVESAVYALMGLLIAFTFYGAGSRFEARRGLLVREANAIGTAYLRVDLLPGEYQPAMRQDFRAYVRSRLDVYRNVPDPDALKAALDRSSAVQLNLWNHAVEAVKGTGPAEKSLIVSNLNEMIDLTTDQLVALTTHPPTVVFAMLAFTVLISSALVGYTMSASNVRDWVSTIVFTLMVSIAVYVIIDYEFPRAGFIRIDPVDQILVDALHKMK
jgi:hypothetical protein